MDPISGAEGLDQEQTDAEPASADGGGGESGTIEGQDGDQAQGQGAIDDASQDENLTPELQAAKKQMAAGFHKKMQALAQEKREMQAKFGQFEQDAKTLYELATKPWFKEALEKSRRSGSAVRHQPLSDEEFQSITSNKQAFEGFLANRENALLESLRTQQEERFGKFGEKTEEIEAQLEFNKAASRPGWSDFSELHDSGALESYIEQGLTYEQAYKMYKFDRGETENPKKVSAEAQRMLQAKRNGAVNRDGISGNRGGPVVKYKTMGDAIRLALEQSAKGVKDFTLERAK